MGCLTAKIAGGGKKAAAGGEPSSGSESSGQGEPKILVGEDYIGWVRRRIVGSGRPLPSFGFDESIVLGHCLRAYRLRYWRRSLAALLTLPGIALGLLQLVSWGWALGLAVAGVWLAFYADRVVAQALLHQLRPSQFLSGHSPEPAGASGFLQRRFQSWALPYTREWRGKSSPKEHFIGAGRLVWGTASIGIDVEPAPRRPAAPVDQDDEAKATLIPVQLQKSIDSQQAAPAGTFRNFTVEELYDFVANRLVDPAPSHAPGHPFADIEVIGVAAVSSKRWAQLDDVTWRSMESLAAGHPDGGPGPYVARRYLWARIISWGGEMSASILVNFAYESGFLRVTVRPHLMAPLNSKLAATVAPLSPFSWRWQRTAWLQAVCDLVSAANRLISGRVVSPKPELDQGGPVSLREIYSTRYIDEMHMYEDARRYVQMMQRRVFDTVEAFLGNHQVDTRSYQAQALAIYNFGVMAGGDISGNIQNGPGATGTFMSQEA
ncbi:MULTISPECIES: hypothetical protein [unclassified Kitasatospora]|uniref:hypothetical protein n=1 Tax=unclassified Kitasatospora TaxID=2633591 RepID=UPI00340D93C8